MCRKIWSLVVLLWWSLPLSAGESARHVELSLPVSGVVEQVLVDAGQSVKRGDTLLILDARRYQIQLNYAEAALQAVMVDLEDAELELSNQLDLFERMVTTESDLKEAKRVVAKVRAEILQQKALRDEALLNVEQTVLKAPRDGVILKRHAEPGEVHVIRDRATTLLLLGVE